ncbi:hypothetical protein STRDD10_01731 [Streptococcus sp. DD10]|uniref:DUF6287 domain-containing protein n=1 Tax=Streptococcus sp. DD10 TaxID=1777878 RepID=UPI000791293E|nr:DUF6287 domain-containing protein [Streptococcus sp. DD10]KXT72826.1 hypothetical protein STRDD10_01731 [Streptococcus sp. DD10]
MKKVTLAKMMAGCLVVIGFLGLIFLSFQGREKGQENQQKERSSQVTSTSSEESRPIEAALDGVSEEQIVRIADSESDLILKGDKNTKKTNQIPQVTDGRVLAQSQFDFAAIQKGDFTSLAGAWQDGYGNLIVFDHQGKITDELALTIESNQYGILSGSYGMESGFGAHVELIPAGIDASVTITDANILYDASNISVDRIWIGDNWASLTDPYTYYYRLKNTDVTSGDE